MTEVSMINEQRMRDAGLSADALRTAARADTHRWSTAPASKDLDGFFARMSNATESLASLSAELDTLPTEGWPGAEPLLEIRENPRMMRSALNEVHSVRRKLQRLPRAVIEHLEEPRTAAVARAYLDASGSVWNADALRIYLAELQNREPLLLDELWVLPVTLRFVQLEQNESQRHGKDPQLSEEKRLAVLQLGEVDAQGIGIPHRAAGIEIGASDCCGAGFLQVFDDRSRQTLQLPTNGMHLVQRGTHHARVFANFQQWLSARPAFGGQCVQFSRERGKALGGVAHPREEAIQVFRGGCRAPPVCVGPRRSAQRVGGQPSVPHALLVNHGHFSHLYSEP